MTTLCGQLEPGIGALSGQGLLTYGLLGQGGVPGFSVPVDAGAAGEMVNGAADRVFNLVEALPLEAHAVMGVVLIVGLALWLFGGRVVKPLFAVMGLALGSMVGLFVVPAVGVVEIGGVPAIWVGVGVGSVIGLIITLLVLKVAIVFAAGLGFAVAGLLGATVYLEHNPLPGTGVEQVQIEDGRARSPDGWLLFKDDSTGKEMTIVEMTRALREADRLLGGASDASADTQGEDGGAGDASVRERLEAVAERCRAVAAEAFEAVKRHINGLNTRERVVVAGATFGGLALGLLVGFVMPKRSTAAVTALAGSAIWLVAGVWLVDALAPSWNHLTDHRAETWGVIWGVVFLVGLVAQLSGLGKSSGKPNRSAGGDDHDGEEDAEDED